MPKNHVVFHHEAFARGSFGSAHRGVWGPGTEVIVKCLTMDESAIGTKSHSKVLSEINIWHQLNHPNVIKMFGASHVSSPPFIVCEEAPYGNLFEFLAKSEQNGRWMWRLLYQAALGLQYIHGMKVVHGDLKLNNILVGAEHTAKLADFGLSAIRMSSALTRATASGATPESGGLRWRAPECLKNRPTFASDVYSLAMCIIEAVSGKTPFGFLSDDDVCFNLSRGEIPDKPEGIFDQAWTLRQHRM
jgi:serine/threonine protein kinase